ncbi:MAG: ZIP family metal transporter [Elusimicrobia bacterium]|nr:ZIP family metal transporter [Elusimicrobiota bacterium]
MAPLLALGLLGSTLAAGIFYRARDWSRRELWRILAFGGATLVASGFNLLVPSPGKEPLFGALAGFAFLFALESYSIVHSCPEEHLEDSSPHAMSQLATFALLFHSLLDGVILGVSAQLGKEEFWGVFVGMAIHKFADAMTMLALFATSFPGYFLTHLGIVFGITLATPIGALVSHVLMTGAFLSQGILSFFAGFSGGCLIYIGASSILPRLHRLRDQPCFFYFILGLVFMMGFLKISGG